MEDRRANAFFSWTSGRIQNRYKHFIPTKFEHDHATYVRIYLRHVRIFYNSFSLGHIIYNYSCVNPRS